MMKNCQNEFVTYNIAQWLDELGFNEKCFGVYTNKDSWQIDCNPGSFYLVGTPNNNINEYAVLAPLWQQTIQFLIDKYDLLIRIDKTKKGWIWNWTNLGNWNYLYPEKQFTYKTYNMCLQIAILETLTTIIKNKNNE